MPRLIAIADDSHEVDRLIGWLAGLQRFVDAVILRFDGLTARDSFERVRTLAECSRRPPLLLSDRPDIALAAGADGVQLKEISLDAADVRRCFPRAWIGASRHDAAGVEAAQSADFVLLSPFAVTPSKPETAPIDRELFRSVAASSRVPVLALGGIDAGHVSSARSAGAAGVAVMRAVFEVEDPIAAARAIRAALDQVRRD